LLFFNIYLRLFKASDCMLLFMATSIPPPPSAPPPVVRPLPLPSPLPSPNVEPSSRTWEKTMMERLRRREPNG
jgi:hypothetical protein